jgi:hypothetical protein
VSCLLTETCILFDFEQIMVMYDILHRFTVLPATGMSGHKGTGPNNGTPPKGRINLGDFDRRILAYSVTQHSSDSTRTLCADRRGFLDHLRPKIFFKNVRHLWYRFFFNVAMSYCCGTKVEI